MKKLVIVGCGRLAGIVSDAVVNGLLPEYDLVGVYSRTAEKAERIVAKIDCCENSFAKILFLSYLATCDSKKTIPSLITYF